MNYFAHGRAYLGEPYVLAGTAVPDWLNVVNRRAKVRSRIAEQFLGDADQRTAGVARGVVQHHYDDRWFHQTRAFVELNLEFTVAIRELLPEPGFRPSFLGHILVELLLDATLIEQQPEQLDEYYRAFDRLDADRVSRDVNRMSTQSAGLLGEFIRRFSAERFLYDYLDDGKLLWRLNHVMRRVRLAALPDELLDFFPTARTRVRRRQAELLAAPGIQGESS